MAAGNGLEDASGHPLLEDRGQVFVYVCGELCQMGKKGQAERLSFLSPAGQGGVHAQGQGYFLQEGLLFRPRDGVFGLPLCQVGCDALVSIPI